MPGSIQPGGLTTNEAAQRLAEFGPNALPAAAQTSLLLRFIRQFKSPILWLLLFAVAFDAAVWAWEGAKGVPFEALAIAVILILNAGLGVFQEYRADEAIRNLESLSAPRVWVFRDGVLVHLPSSELVPGDLVRIEAGDRIPADGVLIQPEHVLLDESSLTGESLPVDKGDGEEVFSGTQMLRGFSKVEVTRTGSRGALGRLATSLEKIEVEPTPLERKVDAFGRQVARWVMVLAGLLFVFGLLIEGWGALSRVLMFAVALAVAAVPEGMPAVLTLTLARGIERMAVRKAIVRRMSAVEALGSVTVIATDKTGTITENRIEVQDVESEDFEEALVAMVLVNDADPVAEVGDPLELASYEYARKQGVHVQQVLESWTRIDSVPFESATKYMRVTVECDGRKLTYWKGAPEVLFDRSDMTDESLSGWMARVTDSARSGHRLIAYAVADHDQDDHIRFLGFARLWDPPRPEVAESIREALDAGIRVIMVTGDHPGTALGVAQIVGLPTTGVITGTELREAGRLPDGVNVCARFLPEDKLQLVEDLKAQGEIVAMTGDGVNDAPSLKRSDVGVAMGQRGSHVAREVADVVLQDDNFATIVAAIEQGRTIFANVRTFINFLFSTNLAELIVIVGGVIGSAALGLRDESGALLVPITAVQLLWINLITDGPPALALGLDEGVDEMKNRPRSPDSPLLDGPSKRFILGVGVWKGLLGLGLLVLLPQAGLAMGEVQTAVFQYLALGQLALAYPSRFLKRTRVRNWALVAALLLGVLLQVAAAFIPFLTTALGLKPLTLGAWGYVVGTVVLTWLGAEILIRWQASPARPVATA